MQRITGEVSAGCLDDGCCVPYGKYVVLFNLGFGDERQEAKKSKPRVVGTTAGIGAFQFVSRPTYSIKPTFSG